MKLLNQHKFDEDEILKVDHPMVHKELKKLIKKINSSENGYHKKNDKKAEDENVSIQFVHYCNENDVKTFMIEYHEDFACMMDIKIKSISKKMAEIMTDQFTTRSDNKKSNMILDPKMEKQYVENGLDNEKYFVYFIKFMKNKKLIELFKNGHFGSINTAMMDILDEEYKKLNEYILNKDWQNSYKIIDFILLVYKKRVSELYNKIEYKKEDKHEKWIKSGGEFWCLVTIIVMFNKNTFINVSNIKNPNNSKNKNLEIDFYVSDDNLAIEIDGKHHNNSKKTTKDQKKKDQETNDKIKNILLGSENIKLIRFNSEDISTSINKLYNGDDSLYMSLSNYLIGSVKEKKDNIISIDDYKSLCLYIKKNTHFSSAITYVPKINFVYEQEYENNMLTCDNKTNIVKTFMVNKKHAKIVEAVNNFEKQKEIDFEIKK